MKIAGIDFPPPLLSALRDGELVVFAGAGVSMGEPACLPSFKELAEKIAQGTGEVLQDETEDRFLGRLHDKGVKVHERAVRELSRNNPKPTALHKNLLRLYRKSEQVRVVTTNFDLLFEEAAQDVFGTVPKVSQAPELPQARDFYGIAHIHGDLNHPRGIVLTDIEQGIRESIQEVLELRFQPPAVRRLADQIAAIDDVPRLKQLHRAAIQVPSLEAFRNLLYADE